MSIDQTVALVLIDVDFLIFGAGFSDYFFGDWEDPVVLFASNLVFVLLIYHPNSHISMKRSLIEKLWNLMTLKRHTIQ